MLAEKRLWCVVGMDGGWCQTSREAAAPPHGELRWDHSPTYDLVKYVNFLCCPPSTKRNSQPEVLICCHNEKALVVYPFSAPGTSRGLGAAWGTPARPAAPHSAARIKKFPAVMEIKKEKRLREATYKHFFSCLCKRNIIAGGGITLMK